MFLVISTAKPKCNVRRFAAQRYLSIYLSMSVLIRLLKTFKFLTTTVFQQRNHQNQRLQIIKLVEQRNYATMIRISVVGFLVNWEIKNCTVYNHDFHLELARKFKIANSMSNGHFFPKKCIFFSRIRILGQKIENTEPGYALIRERFSIH